MHDIVVNHAGEIIQINWTHKLHFDESELFHAQTDL